jgi:hypothetical protein
MKNAAEYIATATAAFDAGFASKAAQKRALDDLNRAFDREREGHGADYRVELFANDEAHGENWDRAAFLDARDVPFDLHHVRERHLAIFAMYSRGRAATVRDLVELRAAIKAAPIATVEPKSKPLEELSKKVDKSLAEIMDMRRAQYREGIELVEVFGQLPVTMSVHVVHGHKGAIFPRRFFFMAGKLTPLNVILAVLQDTADEKGGK